MSRTARTPSRVILPARRLTVVAALLLVATGVVVAINASRDPAGAPVVTAPAAPLAPQPSGRITYEITGQGFFNAKPTGEQLGPAAAEDLHFVHNATAQDEVPGPDGSRVARIQRNDAGTWLEVTGNDFLPAAWQIAGPSDSALVSGGKGAARAVEGIPVVVAWSPNSRQIAWGSITGSPYTLLIADPQAPSQLRTYQVSGGYIGELAWSPDAHYLAISTYSLDRKDHTVFMLDMQRAGSPVRLVDGCHLTWSPDGRYLAIHRDPGPEQGAWVISPDGDERYAVSREAGAFPYSWREG